jgi:hypothetical protein
LGGQFAPELGGQFALELGGQFDRFFQLYSLSRFFIGRTDYMPSTGMELSLSILKIITSIWLSSFFMK